MEKAFFFLRDFFYVLKHFLSIAQILGERQEKNTISLLPTPKAPRVMVVGNATEFKDFFCAFSFFLDEGRDRFLSAANTTSSNTRAPDDKVTQ
jgi:hypothetical protein